VGADTILMFPFGIYGMLFGGIILFGFGNYM
jgi:hypothetical protein